VQTEATQKELAALVKLSARQVHNLTEKGVFTRVPSQLRPGQLAYPLPESLHAYLDYKLQLEREAHQATDTEEAERRKAVADAELKEMKVAQLRRELAATTEYRRELARVLGRVKNAIDVFPTKHAAKLPGDAPMSDRVAALQKIAAELYDALRWSSHVDEDDDGEDAAA
jgi:phage terminase Nu1 subunit (DNA packaging protein)